MTEDTDVTTPFPIDPAKILPCPTDCRISTIFFCAVMMEAVRFNDTASRLKPVYILSDM
jgi:hypothetical protein